jgi:hypothetical protein
MKELEALQVMLEQIDRDRHLLLTEQQELRSELAAILEEQDLADLPFN